MENNRLFRFWVNSSMRDFHVVLGVASVMSWVIGNISQNPKMHVLSDVLTLFAIAHFFIHRYFYRQQKFLSDNQRMYSLPKKKIRKTGGLFLGSFMIFVGVGIAVVREIYTGTLMAKAQALWMYILGMLFGALVKTGGIGSDELTLKEAEEILGIGGVTQTNNESFWESIINSIQTILIIVGVIFMASLLISMLVNYIRHQMNAKRGIQKDKIAKDVSDREESLRGRTTRRESIFDFSPTAKTRRLYKKTIQRLKRRGQIVPENLTPSEIEKMVAMPAETPYQELHVIYEKARYSENGCSEEEAKHAKALKV